MFGKGLRTQIGLNQAENAPESPSTAPHGQKNVQKSFLASKCSKKAHPTLNKAQNRPEMPRKALIQPQMDRKQAEKASFCPELGQKCFKRPPMMCSVNNFMRVLLTDPRTVSPIFPYILRKNLRIIQGAGSPKSPMQSFQSEINLHNRYSQCMLTTFFAWEEAQKPDCCITDARNKSFAIFLQVLIYQLMQR